MNITKEDIGRKVVTEVGDVGIITGFILDYPGDTLPVEVTWSDGLHYWYPVDGNAFVAGLIVDESITFYTEH